MTRESVILHKAHFYRVVYRDGTRMFAAVCTCGEQGPPGRDKHDAHHYLVARHVITLERITDTPIIGDGKGRKAGSR